ncbi:hypothetical protein I862_07325 [endosymbiont of Acanthamoeba sp. UWC8]|nr:hypothetical protein I862_07325 [endosymbiont of Acanthamoeba sp. UWC8]
MSARNLLKKIYNTVLGRRKKLYFIKDWVSLLGALKENGVEYKLFDKLPEAINYNKNYHFIKHDIHHLLEPALQIAKAEHSIGVQATFFMMHEHPLNQKIFNKPETWKGLQTIQDLGHEIALHIDGFILIEKYGCIQKGLEKEWQLFKDNGINIRGGNCHGNTTYYNKLKFEPMSFYKEIYRPHKCQDSFWNQFNSKYSLADLGFKFWADSSCWVEGNLYIPKIYISDNMLDIRAGISDSPGWEVIGPSMQITKELINELVKRYTNTHALYLIHPQFFI